jgi:hypothetical protein
VEYAFHYADIHEISWKFSLRTSFEIEWKHVPSSSKVSLTSPSKVGWTFRGSNSGKTRNFSLLQILSDRLWGPPSLPFNGYPSSFRVKAAGAHSPPFFELLLCKPPFIVIPTRAALLRRKPTSASTAVLPTLHVLLVFL